MTLSVEFKKWYSQYFRQLDNKAKMQYKEKLNILGGIEEPYVEGSSVAQNQQSSGKTGPMWNTLICITT